MFCLTSAMSQDADEAGLMAFLVDKLGFNPERVASGIKKLKEAR